MVRQRRCPRVWQARAPPWMEWRWWWWGWRKKRGRYGERGLVIVTGQGPIFDREFEDRVVTQIGVFEEGGPFRGSDGGERARHFDGRV